MKEEAIARLLYQEMQKIRGNQTVTYPEKVRALYQLLQQLMLERTQRERLHFHTLFARMAYAFQQYDIPPKLQSGLHYFRKSARMVTSENGEALFSLGFSLLGLAVEAFYKTPAPASLRSFLTRELPTIPTWKPSAGFKRKMRVLLLADQVDQHCLLAREDANPEETIRICYNLMDRNENFNASIEFLRTSYRWPVPAYLIDVEIDDIGQYRPAAFVIDPDFLVDVSAISETFQPQGTHPVAYLLKKFLPFASTPPLLLGHIANFFLDEIMSDPTVTFQATFPKVFLLNPLGFSLLNDREIREIMQRSQLHFVNLKRIVQQEFAEQGIEAAESYLEPTFYSEAFGIQGRLDVFYRNETDAAIVELKSGKAYSPNIYGLSNNHFIQTLLYDLLIRSVFNEKLDPKKFILYSGVQERPLRYAPRVKAQQFEALQVRNQLLSMERNLAATFASRPDEPLLQSPAAALFRELHPGRFPHLKGFHSRDLALFADTFEHLRELEQKYFIAFSGFIAREHQLAKTGVPGGKGSAGQASLWLHSRQEKEDSFAILAHLHLTRNAAGSEPPLLYFRRDPVKTNPLANFRKGDITVLYPGEEEDAALSNQLFKCTIVEIDLDQVVVRLRYRQFNDRIFEQYADWNLEPDLLDSSFIGMYRLLFAFMQSTLAKRQLLLGQTAPAKPDNREEMEVPEELTEEQQQIFRKMVAAPEYFLLWGPPGTGKTSMMLKNVVDWYLRNTQENLLLLAYTNRAVDEICEAVETTGADYLRIGSQFSTDDRFQGRLLEQKIQQLSNRREIREMIAGHRLFIGTLASFISRQELLQLKDFDRVIIDEASQILEPMLAGLLTQFKRFILIGDHCQLPAVVVQPVHESEVADTELQEIGLYNMRNSLFERLYKRAIDLGWHWAYDQLSRQGRMHAEIMAFPNSFFYQDRLNTLPERIDPERFQHQSIEWRLPPEPSPLQVLLCRQRLLFLPTDAEDPFAPLKTNRFEALEIANLVRAFRELYTFNKQEFTPKTLGIITPYRAQIAQIREVLQAEDLLYPELTIDTVERYQGGARDIILLSLCTNSAHQLESLISLSEEGVDRRLNVALTRARRHVVILGNPGLLQENPTYQALVAAGQIR